mmetsp:Transcript_2382/g.7115  ORF Transcript_2382/g.7115 Transcript_2382/m.7115 type:complete len:133 (-) Transcript_2382:279-677(-)
MISGFVSSAATGLGIRRCRGMFGCRRVTVRCSSSVEVTREVVEKTARLAQLDFSPEELDRVTPEFKKIIGFVEQMNSLDIEGVEPTLRLEDVSNVLRDDKISDFPNQDELLAEAPLVESDFVRVPKILSEGE